MSSLANIALIPQISPISWYIPTAILAALFLSTNSILDTNNESENTIEANGSNINSINWNW